MIDDLREIIVKVATPSDLATVLVIGTIGFVVDAGLNTVGFLPPGYVGITAASGALGIKKAVEASLVRRREEKSAFSRWQKELNRAMRLKSILRQRDCASLVERLDKEIELFEQYIIDVEEFGESIGRISEDFRSQRLGGRRNRRLERKVDTR